VEVMIWFLAYLVLILAMARLRDHLDASRTTKRRRTTRARNGGVSRRRQIALRPARNRGRAGAERRLQ
jgi:hypothetical protein